MSTQRITALKICPRPGTGSGDIGDKCPQRPRYKGTNGDNWGGANSGNLSRRYSPVSSLSPMSPGSCQARAVHECNA